jgi:cellulose synthase/poly-beta-1,6-N-acetylglucosamine synthase-like glycosyltransferase
MILSIAHAVFWISFLFVAYTYLGYPALLAAWRRWCARPVVPTAALPTVSLVICAHNERTRIDAKLRNVLGLDYPKDRLQVIVGLDGCTDGTEEAVRRYADQGIELVVRPEHHGKAATLNATIPRARGEIVVFADVRQRIDDGALRALVGRFGDPSVGVVTGELVLADETGNEAVDAVGVYWRYEKKLRAWESDVHSVVGATGALYAIRRALVPTLPPGTLLDDVLVPMSAVLRGARCVFEPRARVFDRTPCCAAVEYRRKVRTLAGNVQLLFIAPSLLDPRRNPVWLQFVSHKVARLLVPYALATLLVSNVLLAAAGPLYGAFLAGQAAFYLLAAVGAMVEYAGETDLAPADANGEAS